ncbi:hypothetical protein K1718_24920 [Roseibium porphyridii]|uniref:Capsule polysaccharide biosynthesis protein n=1 Tax=Roseibium porphyridii TaxID=2866279 RepID=A0ABY8F3H3_9HYPH|nr:hypothetical protein [Roseibium sp. KMA01]WFE89359.1 hypothetical protein K1718_24920 [Roseibium sp. KMA01]
MAPVRLGSDDLLCIALPSNLARCFKQLAGVSGQVAFCDQVEFLSAQSRKPFEHAGHLVVSEFVAGLLCDEIEALRKRGTKVHVAVWSPLNDHIRNIEHCAPVDFWSGRLARVPDNTDLGTFLKTGHLAVEDPHSLSDVSHDGTREADVFQRIRGLAQNNISVTSGLARSYAKSYSDVLAEFFPAGEDYDLVVLNCGGQSGNSRKKRTRIAEELAARGNSRKLIFLLYHDWGIKSRVESFGYARENDHLVVRNVPASALFSLAGTVYSDIPNLCIEAGLHGKPSQDLRDLTAFIAGEADSPVWKAEDAKVSSDAFAAKMLDPETYIFDCTAQEFVALETMLARLEELNSLEPVDDIGQFVSETAFRIWPERVFVLGRAGYLDQAVELAAYLSRHYPGTNIGPGAIHAKAVLQYLNEEYGELTQNLSAVDDASTFDRYLPIILYARFQSGDFDEIQNISNAIVRHRVEQIHKDTSVKNLKSLERVLNCLYELDQLLSSYGRCCMTHETRVAVADCLAALFTSWSKLWVAQRIAARSLSRSTIKLLHREDFDIPESLVKLFVQHNKNALMYHVSLLNLLNNNEIITEEHMAGRQRIMAYVGEHTAKEFQRQGLARKLDPVFWANLMSFIAVGYDCSAMRTERFFELEKTLEKHLTGGPSPVETAFLYSGIAKLMSGYIRALEQLSVSNSPTSALACDFLREVVKIAQKRFKSNATIQQDLIRVYTRLREPDEVEKRLVFAGRGFWPNVHIKRMFSDHLFADGRMSDGLRELEQGETLVRNNMLKRADNPSFFKQMNDLSSDHARKKFYRSCADLLSSCPQPQDPKGVVFVLPYDAQNTMAMGVPVMGELRKRGYATHYLGTGILPKDPTGIAEIDKYHGIISYDYTTLSDEPYYERTLRNEWKIDWKNKVLECDGVNYFQGVFEYLANRYRRFDIDIEKAPIQKFFYTQLLKCDRAVSICKDIQSNPALKGVPVRFMAVSAQTSPSYIYKEFCAEVGYKDDMHLIFHINGYENYFSNLGTKVASTMGVRDMTVRPFIRSPLIVRRDMLELPADSEVEKERLKTVLTADRVGVVGQTPVVAAVEKRIREHRAKGGKVIVCYGKVLCDLGVPYDGGPAHRDILDWVNHTIECARKSDALVLIKPHPHELRPEIARHLTQTLFDGITVELPDNVILLGHDWFNNSRLKDMMDVAILWNGTSCLEMSVWGLPVVICAHFGMIDYPVELIAPESRADYERMICAPESLKQHPDSAGLAIDYLQKMGGETVFSPYKYCPRPATNDPVGHYYWMKDDIKKWQGPGDPWVEKMAEEYLRSFTPGERGVAGDQDYERYRAYKHGHGTAI